MGARYARFDFLARPSIVIEVADDAVVARRRHVVSAPDVDGNAVRGGDLTQKTRVGLVGRLFQRVVAPNDVGALYEVPLFLPVADQVRAVLDLEHAVMELHPVLDVDPVKSLELAGDRHPNEE